MIDSVKLPFRFDAGRLKADLAKITPEDWVPHFNKAYYEGDWSVVPLRSIGGSSKQIYPDPTRMNDFADTPILDRCPYFREVRQFFECPLQAARLLRLAAGSRIREHTDLNLGYEDGQVRIHIPVVTNPDVEFFLDGSRIVMNEGESWYLNFNRPHRLFNGGNADRVHFVIDCTVNDWIRSKFAACAPE